MAISALNQTAPRHVHLIAHVDATESTSEPYWGSKPDAFQKMSADSQGEMDGVSRVFRGGTTPGHKLTRGLTLLGAHLAAPAAGVALLGLPGLVVGGLAIAYMVVTGKTREGLGNLVSAHDQRKLLPEGDWKGSKTTDSLGQPAPNGAAGDKPEAAELAQLVGDNLRPGDLNVLYLAGHGCGVHLTAGMKASEVSQGLGQADQKAHAMPDLLLLDSCQEGNLEALSLLKGKAHIALVSEEAVPLQASGGAMPLQAILKEARKGGSNEEIAKRMVDRTGVTEKRFPTLAAVDLDKFGAVTDSLEQLGTKLLGDLEQGKQKEIQSAIDSAQRYPNYHLMPLERAMMHQSDLGGFLDNLQQRDLSPETKAAAAKARQALNDTILNRWVGTGYEQASGVSFQTDTGVMDKNPQMGSFNDADLPAGWKMFLTLEHSSNPAQAIKVLRGLAEAFRSAAKAQAQAAAGSTGEVKSSTPAGEAK